MYLRHTKIRKNGKEHTYWLLVRSVRYGNRVRQEVVASLGKLDARGRRRARAYADRITGRRLEPSLFEPIDTEGAAIAKVRLKRVELERSRRFGDVFLGLAVWHALQLDDAFARLLPEGREDVPWSSLAAALAICRLCMPSSELSLAEDLYRQTALDNLLGIPVEKINDDRLYRALDRILPHKAAIERHLKGRIGELFGIDYDLLLYDVTSTYFEGLMESNPQAHRGHSRDHRPDCKQVCIALVVTRDGIPLAHEVFDGNRVDVTTVRTVVETIEQRFGKANRVWVMDRGMASEANLAWLRAGGRRYVIGAVRSTLRRFEQKLVESKDWQQIRDDIEVKLCPEGEETYILCRSKTRKAKDEAIAARFVDRLRERLVSLRQRLAKAKRPVDRDRVNQQIGRMLARHSRAAKAFTVSVRTSETLASGIELLVRENGAWAKWTERSAGCYLLRSNVRDWTEEELWRTYIQLTEAEAAFRIYKTDLSIRPVWHQREDRVRAHIFVCFLAYAMWKTLEQWLVRSGLGNSPRKILDELAKVQSADIVLPTEDDQLIRLRCVVRPDEAQAHILSRLGVELPRRLCIPKAVVEVAM